METRSHYALIGAFALAVVLGAFTFVYWLSGSGLTRQYSNYEITFAHSVAGLSVGGAVTFNGLKVGEVTRLEISKEDPGRIDALIRIDRATPINVKTKARLDMSTLTGVASIALLSSGGASEAALTAAAGQRYPRIAADTSQYETLIENMQQVYSKATVALAKLDSLLDANGGTLTTILKDTATFTKGLAAKTNTVGDFIADAASLAHSLKPLLSQFDRVLTASESTIKSIDPKKLKTITGKMADVTVNLDRFSKTGLRQYEKLAVDGRKAAESLDRAARSLERDPSQVIFGPSQTAPEATGK